MGNTVFHGKHSFDLVKINIKPDPYKVNENDSFKTQSGRKYSSSETVLIILKVHVFWGNDMWTNTSSEQKLTSAHLITAQYKEDTAGPRDSLSRSPPAPCLLSTPPSCSPSWAWPQPSPAPPPQAWCVTPAWSRGTTCSPTTTPPQHRSSSRYLYLYYIYTISTQYLLYAYFISMYIPATLYLHNI